MKAQHTSRYESEALLNLYLLFHYGDARDLMPYAFGPQHFLHFPVRCVSECIDRSALPSQAKALDLGCAVGRSSFELARYCDSVVAVDNSLSFISAAKQIQQAGKISYLIQEEGTETGERIARIPEDVDPTRVDFRCDDVMHLLQETIPYHVVLAANLLCRLPDPRAFLSLLPSAVERGGQFILISPYSWLEEFTPRDLWIDGKERGTLKAIQDLFKEHFSLHNSFDMPFLIREHLRKYQWGVAQASLWRRM